MIHDIKHIRLFSALFTTYIFLGVMAGSAEAPGYGMAGGSRRTAGEALMQVSPASPLPTSPSLGPCRPPCW